MASPKVKVKLNSSAVRALLRSPEVADDLRRRAERIADTAGLGYETDVTIGKNRARAAVFTDTFQAMHDEAVNHSLLRALDAGR